MGGTMVKEIDYGFSYAVISSRILEYKETVISDKDGLMIYSYNTPTGNIEYAYRIYDTPEKRFMVIDIGGFDTPEKADERMKEYLERMRETNRLIQEQFNFNTKGE